MVERLFLKTRKLNPFTLPGLTLAKLALKKQDSGNFEEALKLFDAAIRLPLNEGWPFVKMADLIDAPEEKLRLYRRAIEIDNHSWAYTGTIKILLGRDQISAAKKAFAELKKTLPKTCWHHCPLFKAELARVESQIKLFDETLALRKRLKQNPDLTTKKLAFGKSKNILFFSPEAPNFDQSSGGNRLFEILKILQTKLGYHVYFFTHNIIDKKYNLALTALGITVFEISPESNRLKELKLKKIDFDFAFFAWWDMAETYIPQVRDLFPSLTVIVDSVDIHWIREERGNISTPAKKNREKQVYLNSDIVFVVTEADRQHLLAECGKQVNVKILSNIHRETRKQFSPGRDIIFIGGFRHAPNIRAALDAHRIFTKFIERTSTDAKLYIVGHNPPKEILKLHDGKRVIVTGFVDDTKPYLSKARVMLAPLTWGAGIKGKICEAVMHKVPIITTDIGNEGIDLKNLKDGWIARTDDEFVTALKNAYAVSDAFLDEMTQNACKKVYALTDEAQAEKVMSHTLNAKPVVISILTYNKGELVEACVRSVIRNTIYPDYRIVVTINGCQDDTEKRIQNLIREFPEVDLSYIKNQKNEFFIRPNNRILEQYKDCDVVLLNNDVEVKTKCWLTELYLAAYSAGYIACAGGKVLFPDGRLAEAGSYILNDGKGVNRGFGESPFDPQYNQIYYTGYVSGCVLYMRRDAIEQIGLLDELYYPMYYEESDWQYRAHIQGLKSIYTPKCVVTHIGSATAKFDSKKYISNNRQKFAERFREFDIEQYN